MSSVHEMDCLREETVSVSGRSGAQSSVASTRRYFYFTFSHLAQWFSIPVVGTPCSAHFACLPYLTHLIEIISLLGERAMN